jgi:predicted enzyme related to lactoylglutathione lyase
VERVRDPGGDAGEPQKIASGWMADCKDDQGGAFSIWSAG